MFLSKGKGCKLRVLMKTFAKKCYHIFIASYITNEKIWKKNQQRVRQVFSKFKPDDYKCLKIFVLFILIQPN